MEPVFVPQDIINLILNLLFYFIIGSFGAFVKDLYETLTQKDEQIRLGKIIVGATCAMFICMFIQEYLNLKITTIVPLTFLLGVLGFEIFGNITSIHKLKGFITMLIEFKKFTSHKLNEGTPEEPKVPSKNTKSDSGSASDSEDSTIKEETPPNKDDDVEKIRGIKRQ